LGYRGDAYNIALSCDLLGKTSKTAHAPSFRASLRKSINNRSVKCNGSRNSWCGYLIKGLDDSQNKCVKA
jgi:hypothetical protein